METLKIADFGMSKKVDVVDRLQTTHKGHTGSLRYMAPEVAFVVSAPSQRERGRERQHGKRRAGGTAASC